PQITISRKDLTGWLVTLKQGAPALLSQNNYVQPLIDNKVAWEELTNAVKTAVQYINCAQLYFDVKKVYTKFSAPPQPGQTVQGERLEDEMYEANHTRNAAVKLIISDIKGLPYPLDTAGHVQDYFNDKSGHSMEFKRYRVSYNQAMHAKFTVIDGKVVNMNASPIMQEYFDDQTHAIDDPRRGALAMGNVIKVPIHDVSVLMKGPVVDHMNQTFKLLWEKAGGAAYTPPAHVPPAGQATHSVQIVRTLPGNSFASIPQGELGILEAYQRAIAQAEDFIYIENQYITEKIVMRSLSRALGQKPGLQVIILVNNKVDAIPYYKWQKRWFNQLIKEAEQKNARDRLGIYTLWTHEPNPHNRIIRNYVHSKVAIVDNKWVTIGSANLDGQGLFVSQHVLWYYSQDDKLEERAIELNAVVYNNIDGEAASNVPDELRRELWKEHLGLNSVTDPEIVNKPPGGWLTVWQQKAEQKLNGLKANPPQGHASKILEWREPKDSEKYLEALGVSRESLKKLKIEEKIKSFSFSEKKWVS
ncbi:hypothetical protein KAR34_02285, partial [bacterium]|nr:hypothetical protein [bacterium]